jgi:Family of unknown function (DUF6084)
VGAVIDLDFAVEDVAVARNSAIPALMFRLRISNSDANTPVENVMLQAQLRIEATHRSYTQSERERLVELFGNAADWDRALRSVVWTNASVLVPTFKETCSIELSIPCSYDFDLAATKFFFGVETGDVPLLLLFSGTIFFRNDEGELQISQIAHHKEATYRLPVAVWQRMMDECHHGSVWLRIDRGLFDGIYRFKRQRRLADWNEALRLLLDMAQAEARK